MASSPAFSREYMPATLSESERFVKPTMSTLKGTLSNSEVQLYSTNLASVGQSEEKIKLEVRAYGKPPQWLLAVARAFEEVLALPAGWDSYQAKPVEMTAVETAFAVLDRIMLETTPGPTVVPTVRGGVQLEWHERDLDLEIVVYPNRRVEVLFEDLGREHTWEGPLADAQGIVAGAIHKLSI